MRNVYQVWEDRRAGGYYAVQLNERQQVVGIAGPFPVPPRAFALPTLTYRTTDLPPKLSNPRWRLTRLSFR